MFYLLNALVSFAFGLLGAFTVIYSVRDRLFRL